MTNYFKSQEKQIKELLEKTSRELEELYRECFTNKERKENSGVPWESRDAKSFNFQTKEEEYSSDREKYKEDVKRFIDYVKICTLSKEVSILYLERHRNKISYGKMKKGLKTGNSIIDMISDADLQNIYQLLKMEFASSFQKGSKHTFGIGWSLLPVIGENVMIDIQSDANYDSKWIYEEKNTEKIIDVSSTEDKPKVNIKK